MCHLCSRISDALLMSMFITMQRFLRQTLLLQRTLRNRRLAQDGTHHHTQPVNRHLLHFICPKRLRAGLPIMRENDQFFSCACHNIATGNRFVLCRANHAMCNWHWLSRSRHNNSVIIPARRDGKVCRSHMTPILLCRTNAARTFTQLTTIVIYGSKPPP